MHRELFGLRSYYIVLCIAAIAGIYVVWHEARKEEYPGFKMLICLAGAVISAILGARVNGWLFWFSDNSKLLNLNLFSAGSGMTAFGGFAGAFGFVALFAWLNRWNIPVLLDIVATVLALTEGIQRIGCFLNGCCYGRTTQGIFGINLPDSLGHWDHRFPSQIITAVFCYLLFFWLWRQRKNKPFNGSIFLYYLVIYNVGRVALDFMRGDEPVVLGYLTAHQITAAVISVVAAIILYFRINIETKETA